jgi:predicted RecB family nuclease
LEKQELMETHIASERQSPGSDAVTPPRPITRDDLESFILCKTKAHLKFLRQCGTKSDFELLCESTREALRRRLGATFARKCEESEILRGVDSAQSVLHQGSAIIFDARIETQDFSLHCDVLKRVSGGSRLGGFHYVPVLVFEDFKIRRSHRLLLEAFALVLAEVQGRLPDHGLAFIHGADAPTRVRFGTAHAEAQKLLREITLLREASKPPILTLNEHCPICEYSQRCRSEAIAEDDISLLKGMVEKTINKFRRRGIATIAQLSRTFRAQKKNKRALKNKRSHSPALQAQAVSDGRIYVNGPIEFAPADRLIFFDLEGDPERNLVYLIGMIVMTDGVERRFSFWADDKSQETAILQAFLAAARDYPDHSLLHYGSYEAVCLKRIKRTAEFGDEIDQILSRSVNMLGVVYGTVYFPSYSNGLKDIASSIGFSWSDPNASGIQSLVWRRRWERGDGDEFKNKLLLYNLEDCAALQRVTELISSLSTIIGAEGAREPIEHNRISIPWAKATDSHASYQKWSTIRFACPDFDYINKCSYFDYQQEKVHVRTGKLATSERRIKRSNPKPRVSRRIEMRARTCPRCEGPATLRSNPRGWKKLVFDLDFSRGGLKRRVAECRTSFHECTECGKHFLPEKFKRLDTFGHGLKSWAMYMHIVHQISTLKLVTLFRDLFGLKVDAPRISRFKLMMAYSYRVAAKRILENLVSGGVIYADETEVKLQSTKGYVWVLSNTEDVFYFYRPSRELDFLKEMLVGFSGVLVTDFYPAYDALNCRQQKCLVHLVRDLNGGLLENPFDEKYKYLTFEFGKLLKGIVTTIDEHGLKRKRLAAHRQSVDRFYNEIVEPASGTATVEHFRGRFLRYREKLFEFMNHDGVAWNNNYAEHAIKVFAQYRVIADGSMNEQGIASYLTLLSINQTCKNKGVGLLKYLLSRERDIDTYLTSGTKGAKPFSLEMLPSRFYIRRKPE